MKIKFVLKRHRKTSTNAHLIDQRSKTELLDGVLARRQLRGPDAQHADHGHAAVAQLLLPHLWRVHLHAKGVAKVARLLLGSLPPGQLQEPAGNEERDEAHN